ncbi:MAG TPA: hypothetical protein VH107_07215 [Lacipirellulaceae bacterium]|nr:hypothetical protein [Lacipirellulaceae bacterium]
MLSATLGPMFFGPSNHAIEMHGSGEPQSFQISTFVPQSIEAMMAGPPVWHDRLDSPMPGLRHDDSRDMAAQFNPGPPMLAYSDPAPQHSSLLTPPSQSSQSLPSPTKYVEEPVILIQIHWEPEIILSVSTAYRQPTPTPAYPPSQNLGLHVDPIGDPIAALVSHDSFAYRDPQLPKDPFSGHETEYSVKSPGAGLPYGVIGTVSTSTPSTSHGLELANFVSTSALDAALQSYTSQLLLATSGGLNSQATITSTAKDLSATDDSDEFVTLRDSTTNGDQVSNADAVARQQAAVADVLKSLEDSDSAASDLAVAVESNADDLRTQAADVVFGTASEIAENDGGMVLLHTNADANESPLNLARVAEAHPDMFSAHLGVEASVGFYEAVDRGFEELSAAETVPTVTPAASSAQAKPVQRFSATSGGTSRKSAGVVAASALAGGLLWVAGRKQSEKRENDPRDKSRLAI